MVKHTHRRRSLCLVKQRVLPQRKKKDILVTKKSVKQDIKSAWRNGYGRPPGRMSTLCISSAPPLALFVLLHW
jgi:hypothetical protein